MGKMAAAIRAYAPDRKLKFRAQKVGKCKGAKRLLYLDEPLTFTFIFLNLS